MKRFKFGFGAKLVAIMVTIVIVAVAVVGYFSVNTLRSNLEAETQLKQKMLAEAFEAQVNQFLVDAMGVIRTIAQTDAVKDVSMVPHITEEVMGVPQEMAADKRALMNFVVDNYGDFAYMEQITAPGRGDNIVIEPWEYQLDLKQLDFGFRDWAQQAIAKDGAHTSEVYISSSLQAPVVAISHPVKDANGALTSIVMGALTIDYLSELAEQLQYGETGQAYLVDQNGVLAGHRNRQLVNDITDVTNVPMVQKLVQGETGDGTFLDPLCNQEVYAHYMPIGDTNWGLVVEQSVDEMYAPIYAAMYNLILICVVLLGIAVIAAFGVTRAVVRPINRLVTATDQAAHGDLNIDINVSSKDEIGQLAGSFNQMLANFRKMVLQIQSTSNNLAASTAELSANAEETTAGANETSSTVTQVSATVEQSARNVQTIQAAADETAEEAEKGHQGIQRIVGQMQDISTSTQTVAGAINSLDEMSGKIGVIVETITSIADQTNLLALNAAIEAARAGEQGRGFAVVAEEVRKLAEQSAGAALEIQQLIEAVQTETKSAADTMHQSTEEVQTGVKVVNEVGQAFINSIDKIKGLASQVDEITQGTEQISTAVEHVAGTTEETTAAMEEIASSINTLTQMADELQSLTEMFKIEHAKDHVKAGKNAKN